MTVLSPAVLSASDRQQLLLDAFPAKARMVNYGGVRGKVFGSIASGLLGVALTVWCLYFWVPGIVRDARLMWFDAIVVDQEAAVSGSCKIARMVYVNCDVKISYRPDPARAEIVTVEQYTSFFGFSHSNNVDVLRSTTHPHRITTSLATEHLGARIVSFLLLLVICVIGTCVAWNEFWHTFRHRRLQGKEVVLQPVLAMIYECDNDRNVKFTASVDGVDIHRVNCLRYGDCPIVLPWKPNLTIALLASGTRYMILLDKEMTVADFTESEKALLKTLLS